jgi:hypothetical protein
MVFASIWLTLVVGVLGAIDTLYFHFWKFRLFERPQSRREHLTHGIRAALVGPTLMMLFVWPATGLALWAVAGLVVADFAVMLWDLAEESESRRALGGIPPVEYAIHVVASALHAAASALALASRPLEAWSSSEVVVVVPSTVTTVAGMLWPGAVLLALIHFVLLSPRFVKAPTP